MSGSGHPTIRDLRRAVLSLASYLLRWQRRVTPFGLFAGVVPAAVRPASATDRVRALLDEEFLISDLHPPMTAGDPLGHLCAALRTAGADEAPDVVMVFRELVEGYVPPSLTW